MRTGLIAEKVGMMSLFQDNGTQVPVTVLKIDSTVVDVRTMERDGYVALQLRLSNVFHFCFTSAQL